MMNESVPEAEKSITSALARTGPEWAPTYTYEEDNQGRHSWTFEQTLSVPQSWKVHWRAIHRHAEFFDATAPKVIDNSVGAGADMQLGLFNTLYGEGVRRFLTGQAQDTVSAFGRLDSPLSDDVETFLSGGRSLYYTARALDHHVNSNFADALVKYRPDNPWTASARGRYLNLSDDNRRRSIQAEVSPAPRCSPNILRFIYPIYVRRNEIHQSRLLQPAGPADARIPDRNSRSRRRGSCNARCVTCLLMPRNMAAARSSITM